MIRVSSRFLPALAAILALAAVPVIVLGASDRRWENCADPAALREVIWTAGGESARELEHLYRDGIFQWTRGTLGGGGGAVSPVTYQILRSDDALNLYQEPTEFLSAPMDPESFETRWVKVDGESVPIGVTASTSRDWIRLSFQIAIYNGRPIASLIGPQLSGVAAQLVHGSRPLTLLMASGLVRPDLIERLEEPAISWLTEAWRTYRSVCRP